MIVEGRGRQGKGLDDDFHPRRPTSPKFQGRIDLVLPKQYEHNTGQATRAKARSSTPNIHEGACTGLPTAGLLQYSRDTSTVHSLSAPASETNLQSSNGTLATTDHGRQKSLSTKEIGSHIQYTYAKTTPLRSIRRSFASSGRLEAGASQFRRERVWKASGGEERTKVTRGARRMNGWLLLSA